MCRPPTSTSARPFTNDDATKHEDHAFQQTFRFEIKAGESCRRRHRSRSWTAPDARRRATHRAGQAEGPRLTAGWELFATDSAEKWVSIAKVDTLAAAAQHIIERERSLTTGMFFEVRVGSMDTDEKRFTQFECTGRACLYAVRRAKLV